MLISATYSPDDNKIRLYASQRLDSDLYARVKAAGFKWAPKQDLFFAPMWTPGREDLALELAGEITDEDKTLTDRAEDRADRFVGCQENRTKDAQQASATVSAITDNIPLGQPILVGHHSEKHARRQARRIEQGMTRAVKMWDTAAYWKGRAAGAIRHAKYLERPDVRARRIKKIEAALRQSLKETDTAEAMVILWQKVADGKSPIKRKDGEPVTPLESALWISNRLHISVNFTLDKYPRTEHTYEGPQSIWSGLRDEIITPLQAATLCISIHERGNKRRARWAAHYENRLIYEKAMLEAQGESDLLKPKKRAKLPALLNYDGPRTIEGMYGNKPHTYTDPRHMTKAEYSKIHTDYKGTRMVADGSHRVRVAMFERASLNAVYLTDSKTHIPPAPTQAPPKEPAPLTMADRQPMRSYTPPEPVHDPAAAMRKALKAGVKSISADQLFQTPRELAERMRILSDIKPGQDILEPSAGMGALIGAMGAAWRGYTDNLNRPTGRMVAIEINHELCKHLKTEFPLTDVINKDFLGCTLDELGSFDRIVMNPPFKNADDIKHIKHARKFLKPGGILVAICADGPRQRDQLTTLANMTGGSFESLPAGSFADSGTQVNAAIVVIKQAQSNFEFKQQALF